MISVYRRRLDLNPKDLSARYGLALELEKAGCYDAALAELRELLKLDPNNLQAREAILRIISEKDNRS